MKIQSVLQKVLCIAACAAVSSVVAQTVEKPIPPIHTEGGQLAGKVLASGVKAWLGVPYAKPPINDLRWQPPQPFSWKGVWNADRTMPECLQVQRSHDTNQYFGEEPASENCLYMNIWAPANATAGAKLPSSSIFTVAALRSVLQACPSMVASTLPSTERFLSISTIASASWASWRIRN